VTVCPLHDVLDGQVVAVVIFMDVLLEYGVALVDAFPRIVVDSMVGTVAVSLVTVPAFDVEATEDDATDEDEATELSDETSVADDDALDVDSATEGVGVLLSTTDETGLSAARTDRGLANKMALRMVE